MNLGRGVEASLVEMQLRIEGEGRVCRCSRYKGAARSGRALWVWVRMLPFNPSWGWGASECFELKRDLV